jgi:tRNA dimethylallyltransferase
MDSEPRDSRPPVVVVTGPTASGKTSFAIEIARRFDGEIVNADSMQVYRWMDIGTAKATPAQRAEVPHHLLDIVAPDIAYNAARFHADARAAAERIHGRDKLVVLTGGTGLYIRVFLEGVVGGAAPDPEFRESLEREHAGAVEAGEPDRLHRRLVGIDPDAAERIHPNDLRRTIRALEIARQGGIASERRRAHAFSDRPYRVLHLALDSGRETLNERIDQRCSEMIEAGLLQETRDLRARGYGPELPSMQSIGYRHMQPVVAGSDTLANALIEMQRDTRRFARRQRTWLRGVPECVWLNPAEAERGHELVAAFIPPP